MPQEKSWFDKIQDYLDEFFGAPAPAPVKVKPKPKVKAKAALKRLKTKVKKRTKRHKQDEWLDDQWN